MKNISFALLSLIVGSALSFAAETLRPGEAAKIGVDPAYMTWGQVNALVKRGCELGAMVSHNPVRARAHREGRGMPGGLRRLLGESRPGGGEDPSRTSASVSRP